jgi:hypothetical protein
VPRRQVDRRGAWPARADRARPRSCEEWKLEEFIAAVRTGVDPNDHALSKQMPWQPVGRMSDEELRAVYEYLTHFTTELGSEIVP